MARPREFDLNEALDAATAAFWRRGYEATSLADLMSETGLQKGSIYKAFGDKHRLFMCVLERYLGGIRNLMREASRTGRSPRGVILKLFTLMIDSAPIDGRECRGCFAVNTLVELGPYDDQVRTLLDQHFLQIRRHLHELVKAGQDRGEIRGDQPSAKLAQFLLTQTIGLLAGLKGALSKAEAHRQARLALDLIA
ncbi:MAG: TetR/AcrR family transcriptional regulator [Pseudomonadota bacterium]